MTAPPAPVVPAVYGAFNTTLDAVFSLCPEAERVTDGNASKMPTPITEATVALWIVDVSSAVAGGIGPWTKIPDPSPPLDLVMAAGRAVVANGTASYLEAARYPTRAGMNDSSYAGVLWARYLAGIEALKAQVKLVLEEEPPGLVPGDDGTTMGGPFGSFPPTYFADGMWW